MSPVLTWWEGKATQGLGTGTHVILDDSYRVVARVPAGHGRQSDLHESLHHAARHGARHELRGSARRPDGCRRAEDGKVIGGMVQEIALPSGRVLFEWKSLDHVDISETHVPFAGPRSTTSTSTR